LSVEISFPFSSSRVFKMKQEPLGLSKKYIIDSIREFYKHTFRHCNEPLVKWEGDKSNCCQMVYPISHLFVEQIIIDTENKLLTVIANGTPVPKLFRTIPF
ncbi:MAG: hypothetical protein WBM99_15925, partial [Psychromonas sp.]